MFNPFISTPAPQAVQRIQALTADNGPAASTDGGTGANSFAQALAQRKQAASQSTAPKHTQRSPRATSDAAPKSATEVRKPAPRPDRNRRMPMRRPSQQRRTLHGPRTTAAAAKPASEAPQTTSADRKAAKPADPSSDSAPDSMSTWLSRWTPAELPAEAQAADTGSSPVPLVSAPTTDTAEGGAPSALPAFSNPFGATGTDATTNNPATLPAADMPKGMVMTPFGPRPAPAPGAPITNPFIDAQQAVVADAQAGIEVPGDTAAVNVPVLTDPDLAPATETRPADPAATSAQTGVIDPAMAAALLAGQLAVPTPPPAGGAMTGSQDPAGVVGEGNADSSERRFMSIVPRGSLPMRSPFGEPGSDLAANEHGLPPGGLPDPSLTALPSDVAPERNPFGAERPEVAIQATASTAHSFSQMLEVAAQSGVHAAGQAAGMAGSAPAIDVTLPTPVQSPEFPEALGVQVSLLARDGVQHAELHLNPSEMGPISVRIALEGNQAQINFGADSATTRALIEAGLPELASALRDSGLTLSGGGVSQHPRDTLGGSAGEAASGNRQDSPNGQGGRQHGSSTHRGDAGAATAAPPMRRARVANGVDLYA